MFGRFSVTYPALPFSPRLAVHCGPVPATLTQSALDHAWTLVVLRFSWLTLVLG